MVIAAFLNRHLLEPQKQRLVAQGRQQERNNICEHLRRQGHDPDELLPPQDDDGK